MNTKPDTDLDDEDEDAVLDFDRVRADTQELIKLLEFKDLPKLVRPAFLVKMADTVEHIEDFIHDLSYTVRANKAKAVILKRIVAVYTDITEAIVNLELSKDDLPGYLANLTGAFKDAEETFAPTEESLDKFDSSTLFSMARDQAVLNGRLFRDKNKNNKKRKLHRKIRADILLHCSPIIMDGDAAAVGLQFRVVDGYVHLRDQRILMIDSPATSDQYEYARKIAREDQNKRVPVETIYYAEGVAYAWFVEPRVISNLLSNLEINAWCCVRNEQ
jgi:hypothetical protein